MKTAVSIHIGCFYFERKVYDSMLARQYSKRLENYLDCRMVFIQKLGMPYDLQQAIWRIYNIF